MSPPPPPISPMSQYSMQDERMSRLRVLVADPYSQLREIMRDILVRGIGVGEVLEVRDGEEALATLRELPCDVVIADAGMKPLGGIGLTKLIRKGVENLDTFTPVIIVSGHADINEIIEARDAGANEYLAKPLSAKILDLRLHAVIDHPRPFVRTDDFFGPDRRRHREGHPFKGEDRRSKEAEVIAPEMP